MRDAILSVLRMSRQNPMKPRAKIALAALYFEMFDEVMPPSFRQEKENLGREVASMLATFAEVDYPGLIASPAQAARSRERWMAQSLDAVVIFPTMASPPAYSWDATRDLHVPILLWNGHLIRTVPDDFTYSDANRYSGNVGTIMISNVFLREGRPFELLSGYYRDPQVLHEVEEFLSAAAALQRLRSARIGRIGREISGYTDVSIDGEALRNCLGTQVVSIEKDVWQGAYNRVEERRIREHSGHVLAEYEVEMPEDLLDISIRIALALEDIVSEHSLNALAINCHSDFFRHNPQVGLVACYGASRLTAAGLPVSCTGDTPTAIAMLVLKALGGQSQYCECVVTDHERDFILLTNTGEGDPGIARADRKKRLICNHHYPGCRGGGASPVFSCRSGIATLVAFSPKRGASKDHILVAAPGEILGTFHEQTTVTNATFRFKSRDSINGFNSWCLAGAPHHGAFTLGDFSRRLEYLGRLWGLEFVQLN